MSNKRIDLTRWSIFALLEKEFMSKIKLACVFGNSGNEALMVTIDNEVYALGFNGAGCHGVGDTTSSLIPRKITALCGKEIHDVAYGSGPHILALTKSKQTFDF